MTKSETMPNDETRKERSLYLVPERFAVPWYFVIQLSSFGIRHFLS